MPLKKNSTAIWICIRRVQAQAQGLVKIGGLALRFSSLAGAHLAHPVQAQSASDRRETQDQQQADRILSTP